MKILYAVQATGNGHISRALEILPYLKQYGHVDVFLSGANSNLSFDHPVKYRSKGFSLFFNCKGGLNYLKTINAFAPYRLWKEAHELPVEKYDLILNDFECITAIACESKKNPSINFGHQASFVSEQTPRPKEKSRIGEWILKNYAPASFYVGLHFQRYDKFILPPIIKKAIAEAEPSDKNFITVYLPGFCENTLKKVFQSLPDFSFHIFSRDTKQTKRESNVIFFPIDKTVFNKSFIHCTGIITGAGFETPAEAIKMGKKLMVLPIKKQYEQQCNAAALEKIGIKKSNNLNDDFSTTFYEWINTKRSFEVDYNHSTESIIEEAMKLSIAHCKHQKLNLPFEKNIKRFFVTCNNPNN